MTDSSKTPAFQTKSAYAAGKLRDALRQGEYIPGQRLRVAKLAKELGLSLTPVREALATLASEGLVEIDPHRGAKVAEISLPDLSEVYMVRMMLEPAAARLAAERMEASDLERLRKIHKTFIEAVEAGDTESLRPLNDEFHLLIYDSSRSPLLVRLIRLVWSMAPHDTFTVIPERAARTVEEHAKILEVLGKRSPAAAEKAVRHHVAEAFDLVRSAKELDASTKSDARRARRL